jgi:DNA-binding ferritin-like protein
MEYSNIKGHSHLKRDQRTNSIINTNMSEYNEYLARRKIKSEENQKIQSMEKDLANIRCDLDEIKNLLRGLANGPR